METFLLIQDFTNATPGMLNAQNLVTSPLGNSGIWSFLELLLDGQMGR